MWSAAVLLYFLSVFYSCFISLSVHTCFIRFFYLYLYFYLFPSEFSPFKSISSHFYLFYEHRSAVLINGSLAKVMGLTPSQLAPQASLSLGRCEPHVGTPNWPIFFGRGGKKRTAAITR